MDPEEHAYRYSTKNERRLRTLCEPLKKIGIHGFLHITLCDSGYMSLIGTHGEASEYFYHNQNYIEHPLFRAPKYLGSGMFFGKDDPSFYVAQKAMVEKFSIDNILIDMANTGRVCRVFGFILNSDISNIATTYVRHFPLLNKFKAYFRREADDLVRQAELNKVDIASLVGDSFYKKKDDLFYRPNPALDVNEFQELPALSLQERACIYWIIRGRTAGQTAKELNLSKRTVENYISNIKNKWGCDKKQDLIDCAIEKFNICLDF